ncbi:hypothetical protein R5R35_002951 [Gryllus longicercus]|uniref:Uncharacterized protein n=1 Tax=Gryllus longicercus TaxID=2509291 RepID=A0AAN9V4A9_9ORTH
MKRRLAEAQERGIGSLKPWSLRCSESTFQRTIERRVKAREFLGDHKSVKDYLATRLQCDEKILTHIFRKIPQMKHITVLKVKELLDFLYDVGYSPEEVCCTPRILTRSLRTVKARVVELELLGITHPNLLVLCKTTKEYQDLIRKLKHNQ